MLGISNINHQSLQATQPNSSNPNSGQGSHRPSGVVNHSERTQNTTADSNVIRAHQYYVVSNQGGQAAPHEQIERLQGCIQALLPSASTGLGVGIVAGGFAAVTSVFTVASVNALFNVGTSLATAAQTGAVGGSILGSGIGFFGCFFRPDVVARPYEYYTFLAGTLFLQPAANLIGNAVLAYPLTLGVAASAGVGGTVLVTTLATTLLATSYLCRE